MGLGGIETHGVESDDLLASEALTLSRAGHEVLIVSADKDFAQIVGERIAMLSCLRPRPIPGSAGAGSTPPG